jgi:hypothetical protein
LGSGALIFLFPYPGKIWWADQSELKAQVLAPAFPGPTVQQGIKCQRLVKVFIRIKQEKKISRYIGIFKKWEVLGQQPKSLSVIRYPLFVKLIS